MKKKLAVLIMICMASSLAEVEASLSLSKGIAYTGEDARVYVTLTNPSHLAERDITLTLLLPEEIGGNRERNISVIGFQDSVTEEFKVPIPSDTVPGYYPVNVKVAYSDKEYTLRDAKMLRVLKFPLKMDTSLEPESVSSKANTTLKITLQNIGTTDLENVSIKISADQFVGIKRKEIPVNVLLTGQENSIELEITAPSTPGEYMITVYVEFDDITGHHIVYKTVKLSVSKGFDIFTVIVAVILAAALILLYKRFRG